MSGWLRRQPLLLVACFAAQSRWRRKKRLYLIALLATLAMAAGLGVTDWLRGPMSTLHELTLRYLLPVTSLTAVHALFLVSRRRRILPMQHAESWLAAAPIDDRAICVDVALRSIGAASFHLSLILVAILVPAWFAGRPEESLPALIVVAAGFLLGAACGWFLRSRNAQRHEPSRYAPRASASTGLVAPSMQALSRWPIAEALVWYRPENSRVVLLALLFTVQGGSSAVTGLIVLSAWAMGLYLVSLLQATLRVSRAAADWLRSTPVAFVAFAWPIARRSLLHQSCGALAAAACGVVLGLPPALAAYFCALWLGAVTCATAVVLVDSYCRRPSGLKLASCAIGVSFIEWRQLGWGLALAIGMALWHVHNALEPRKGTT